MRRVLAGAAAVAGGALLVAGCSSGGSTASAARPQPAAATGSAAAAAPVTVRLGYLANITHAPALIAVKNGYFAKELGSAGTVKTTFHQRHAGDDGDPGRASLTPPTSARTRRSTPGRSPNGTAIKIISGVATGGAVHRREALHHLRGAAQGAVARQPVARQHPGRGGALLAQAAGADHQRDRRRRRLDQADQPQLGRRARVQVRADRRRLRAVALRRRDGPGRRQGAAVRAGRDPTAAGVTQSFLLPRTRPSSTTC